MSERTPLLPRTIHDVRRRGPLSRGEAVLAAIHIAMSNNIISTSTAQMLVATSFWSLYQGGSTALSAIKSIKKYIPNIESLVRDITTTHNTDTFATQPNLRKREADPDFITPDIEAKKQKNISPDSNRVSRRPIPIIPFSGKSLLNLLHICEVTKHLKICRIQVQVQVQQQQLALGLHYTVEKNNKYMQINQIMAFLHNIQRFYPTQR